MAQVKVFPSKPDDVSLSPETQIKERTHFMKLSSALHTQIMAQIDPSNIIYMP